MHRTALVMGITGGFGGQVARALLRHGWTVRALLRDPARLPAELADVTAVAGDAGDPDAVERALGDASVVVYGVNVPYPRWRRDALRLFAPTLDVAERHGARVVFPGNVYNFDPADGPRFAEDAPQRAPSRKGRIRVAMERRLRESTQKGAKALVVRCGDFFGPGAPSAWLNVVVKRGRRGTWTFHRPGDPEHRHAWAFLPDVAEATARLLDRPEELADWEVFHFRGHHLTLAELGSALAAVVGPEHLRTRRFPWTSLTVVSPFVPFLRELRELAYLWREDVELTDDKLRARLGEVPRTPLRTALAETLAA